jgi:hypothetical protein
MNGTERHSIYICTNSYNGTLEVRRNAPAGCQQVLTGLASDGHVKPGLTLHGLRVTLAAEFKRQGEHDGIVSDILGAKSEKMGRHYIHDRKGLFAAVCGFP